MLEISSHAKHIPIIWRYLPIEQCSFQCSFNHFCISFRRVIVYFVSLIISVFIHTAYINLHLRYEMTMKHSLFSFNILSFHLKKIKQRWNWISGKSLCSHWGIFIPVCVMLCEGHWRGTISLKAFSGTPWLLHGKKRCPVNYPNVWRDWMRLVLDARLWPCSYRRLHLYSDAAVVCLSP